MNTNETKKNKLTFRTVRLSTSPLVSQHSVIDVTTDEFCVYTLSVGRNCQQTAIASACEPLTVPFVNEFKLVVLTH